MEHRKRYTHIVNTLLLLLLVGSSYEITATEVEPNDVTPQPIDFGDTIVGQLSSITDVDKFSVSSEAAGTLTLSFSSDESRGEYSNDEHWYFELLDSANNVLSSTECYGDKCQTGLSVPVGLPSASVYVIRVRARDQYSSDDVPKGLYRLSVTYSEQTNDIEFEPNDVTPQPINFGDTIVGQLSSITDVDLYSLLVTGKGNGTITLSFSSDESSGNSERWYFELLDSTNNVLSSTECYGNECQTGLSVPVGINSCQTYKVRVRAKNRSNYISDEVPKGLYRIVASQTGLDNPALNWIDNKGHGTIPDSVTNIDDNLLSCATNLTSITIPSTVTSIGSDAFRDTGLTSLVIPDSVKTLGSNAFYGAPIESLVLGNSLESWGGNDAFYNICSTLTSAEINMPSIPNSAFVGCTLLSSLTIGDTVTEIGSSAFYGASSLTSVTIPDSVTSIGRYSFALTKLTTLFLGEGLITIGEGAFKSVPLIAVSIPDSVTSIGALAFDFIGKVAIFVDDLDGDLPNIDSSSFGTNTEALFCLDINTDGDYYPNCIDDDDDNDGVSDADESINGTDPLLTDTDGDGVSDKDDQMPLDWSERLDTDGDGIGNRVDVDDDGDLVTDDTELINGTDPLNPDTDQDGVSDGLDQLPLDSNEYLDSDGDGIGNNADDDDDNDGVLDINDDLPFDPTDSVDTDGDGVGNTTDLDDDGDRILDSEDAYPLNGSESVDTDGDGIGDNADNDDDNDGVNDAEDVFDLDATESVDTDGDGIGNNEDTDDDGDGTLDQSDAFPLKNTESIDSDNDGIGDNDEARAELIASDVLVNKMISYAGLVATESMEDMDEIAGDSGSWTLSVGQSNSQSIACANGGGYNSVLTRTGWTTLKATLDLQNCIEENNLKINGAVTFTYDDSLWEQPTPRQSYPFVFSFANVTIQDTANEIFRYSGSLYCDFDYNSVAESWTYKYDGENRVYEGRWGSIFDELNVNWDQNYLNFNDQGNTHISTVYGIDNCDYNNVSVTHRSQNHTIVSAKYLSESYGTGYNISEYTRSERLLKAQNKEVFFRQIYTPQAGWSTEVNSGYDRNPVVRLASKGDFSLNVYSSRGTYNYALRENVDDIIFQEVDQFSELDWVYLDPITDKISATFYRYERRSLWDYDNDGVREIITVPWAISRFGSVSECDTSLLRYDDWIVASQSIDTNPNGLCLFNTGFDVYDGYVWYQDTNLDGINELFTLDDDQDGVQDNVDAFSDDPTEWIDSDGDGIGNNADPFPNDSSESQDSDGDGVGDNIDVFPFDGLETLDADGDGLGNNADLDDDNDGIVDVLDMFPFDPSESTDADEDGVGDNSDMDDDNDGYPDTIDAFPLDASESLDTDDDGVGNNADTDDDGDSIPDAVEVNNGTNPLLIDTDNDGASDNLDFAPLNALEQFDTDGDGIGDNSDQDDDNDGVNDVDDDLPLDASESVDSDGDGVGDNADAFPNDASESLDSDLDGVGDNADAFPNDASETSDSDSDGAGDNSDAFPNNSLYKADSDNDGMPDAWESRYGLDPNDPSDATSDQDNDGVSALDEFLAGTIPSGSIDLDGNERYDALTDGLLLLRGMFGLDGSALVTGTIASDAAYTESADIESRIAILGDLADIDGNGEIDALTDGLLTLRYLFGLEGDTLINGVVAGDATRTSAEEIEAHLETLMPAL